MYSTPHSSLLHVWLACRFLSLLLHFFPSHSHSLLLTHSLTHSVRSPSSLCIHSASIHPTQFSVSIFSLTHSLTHTLTLSLTHTHIHIHTHFNVCTYIHTFTITHTLPMDCFQHLDGHLLGTFIQRIGGPNITHGQTLLTANWT